MVILFSIPLFAQDWQADLRKENPKLAKLLDQFMQADTAEAKQMLAKFTNDDLELIWSYYKASKPTKEQRYFWLIEEHEYRKADGIASERLKYAFWAVLLLMLLILVYTARIYKSQMALEKEIEQLKNK
ncbi:MAG: hypothetical protein D6767_06555 [Candidatus Hydrogenedentota bacterium]|nr:MAG: hypothetical protein D6767_06555 [Candidatus Hydrogenedentota bacterium]